MVMMMAVVVFVIVIVVAVIAHTKSGQASDKMLRIRLHAAYCHAIGGKRIGFKTAIVAIVVDETWPNAELVSARQIEVRRKQHGTATADTFVLTEKHFRTEDNIVVRRGTIFERYTRLESSRPHHQLRGDTQITFDRERRD